MQERRMSVRRVVNVPGAIMDDRGALLAKGKVLDISTGGAKLAANGEFPDDFVLVLSGNGRVRRGCRVVWRNESEIGVRFQAAPPPSPPLSSPPPDDAATYLD